MAKLFEKRLCSVEGVRRSRNWPDAFLRGPAASLWAFGRGRGGLNPSTQRGVFPSRDVPDRTFILIPPRARPRLPRRREPPFHVSEGACTTSSRRCAGLHRAGLHHAGLHRAGIHHAARTPLASSASRLLRRGACISCSPQVKSGVCPQR
jgi:hypothetical protein